MNDKIQAWRDARELAALADEAAQKALDDAKYTNPPSNLRPATAVDVQVGTVFWYVGDDPYWALVEEVLHPNDPWKAYCAHDGCRYGLEDAMVEDK